MNAITQGLFDTNLKTFSGFGSKTQWDNSWELTATELMGLVFGGSGGMAKEYSLSSAVKRNLRVNGGMMLAQVIGIPIAFRYGRKLLRKPMTAANKLLKPAGVRI